MTGSNQSFISIYAVINNISIIITMDNSNIDQSWLWNLFLTLSFSFRNSFASLTQLHLLCCCRCFPIDLLINWLNDWSILYKYLNEEKKNYLNNHHLIFERKREREKKTKSIIEMNKTLKVKLIKIMTDKLSVCEHEKKKQYE